MTRFIRAYLRGSTKEQDANRARSTLDKFANDREAVICNYYVENESGAHLNRPELLRLLADSLPNDILLIEDVDRLTRLKQEEWEQLKTTLKRKNILVVAVNVPTTWAHLSEASNDFDRRIFLAINDMFLDFLAAIARRDYERRRETQKQGIAKAKTLGLYRGRKPNKGRYDAINKLLANNHSWSEIQNLMGCSRGTISAAIKSKNENHESLTKLPR